MNNVAEIIKLPTQPLSNTMTKGLLLAIFITALTGFSIPAKAGGGDYCGANFSLDNRLYNECKINFPTLDTGNDTQTNLYLLIADKGLINFDISSAPDLDFYSDV